MPIGMDGVTPPPTGGFTLDSDVDAPQVAATGSLSQYASNLGVPLGGATAARPAQDSMVPPLFSVPVFQGMGTSTWQDTPRGFGSEVVKTKVVRTKTIKRLTDELLEADRKDQKETAFLLVLAGYGPAADLEDIRKVARQMTLGELVDAYHNLLEAVAVRNQMGQKVTPADALRESILYRLPPGISWDGKFGSLGEALEGTKLAVGGRDGLSAEELEEEPFTGTKTFTSTDKNIIRDIMDPRDAKALTRAMLNQELGRDPTDGEFEDFISTLMAAQRQDPTIQTTTTTRDVTYEEGEMVDQDTTTRSTTKQGMTAAGLQDIALERARSQPDWAEFQAMGTYAPALFAALGSTVEGV